MRNVTIAALALGALVFWACKEEGPSKKGQQECVPDDAGLVSCDCECAEADVDGGIASTTEAIAVGYTCWDGTSNRCTGSCEDSIVQTVRNPRCGCLGRCVYRNSGATCVNPWQPWASRYLQCDYAFQQGPCWCPRSTSTDTTCTPTGS